MRRPYLGVCRPRKSSTAWHGGGVVFRFLPLLHVGGVGGQRVHVARRNLGMVQVATRHHQQRRLAGAHEIPRRIEQKIAAVHACLERFPGVRAHLRAVRLQIVRPAVEHVEERLPVVVQADGLKQHGRRHALRRLADQPHDVGPADTHADHVKALHPEVVEQGELVLRVHVPAVVGADWRRRAAGVALVHGNDPVAGRQMRNRIPRRRFPIGHCRAHAAGGDEQHRKTAAVRFVI